MFFLEYIYAFGININIRIEKTFAFKNWRILNNIKLNHENLNNSIY